MSRLPWGATAFIPHLTPHNTAPRRPNHPLLCKAKSIPSLPRPRFGGPPGIRQNREGQQASPGSPPAWVAREPSCLLSISQQDARPRIARS